MVSLLVSCGGLPAAGLAHSATQVNNLNSPCSENLNGIESGTRRVYSSCLGQRFTATGLSRKLYRVTERQTDRLVA